jgi:hypothetical protein
VAAVGWAAVAAAASEGPAGVPAEGAVEFVVTGGMAEVVAIAAELVAAAAADEMPTRDPAFP